MADALHMNTDSVRSIAQQIEITSQDLVVQLNNLGGNVQDMDWRSNSREIFVDEFLQSINKLSILVEQGNAISARVLNEVSQWEETSQSGTNQTGSVLGVFTENYPDYPIIPFFNLGGLGKLSVPLLFSSSPILFRGLFGSLPAWVKKILERMFPSLFVPRPVPESSTPPSVDANQTPDVKTKDPEFGKPKVAGTKGDHTPKEDFARDKISSNDPRVLNSLHRDPSYNKRVGIEGREVYAAYDGTIDVVSCNDGSSRNPPTNDPGITIIITAKDGTKYQYTHFVPGEKLLAKMGITKEELRTTTRKFTSLGEVKKGDQIGFYSQIGDSDKPHLHIKTWDNEVKLVDPDSTDVTELALD